MSGITPAHPQRVSLVRLETNRVSLDEARLMPRFRAQGTFLQQRRMEKNQAVVLAAALEQPDAKMPKRKHFVPSPEDLRGIPAMGKGVSGTIRGTAPHIAFI